MLNNKALQVPYGTRDVLPGEAGARRIIENKLASTFKAWGYDEVVSRRLLNIWILLPQQVSCQTAVLNFLTVVIIFYCCGRT